MMNSSHGKSTVALPSVLIVDESPRNRSEIAQHLNDYRWTVREAATGQEGLVAASAKPSVIVVDEVLPDMTGREFRDRILSKPELRQIPVLIVSANEIDRTSEIWSESRELYLTKPVNLQELVATVKGLFQLRRVADQSESSHSRMTRMIDSMMEGVITVDRSGTLLTLNPAALTIYGFVVRGEKPRDLDEMDQLFEHLRLDGTPLPRSEWPVTRAFAGEVVRGFEICLVQKKTGRSWVGSFNATLLSDPMGSSENDIVLITVFDVTARRADEASLEKKVADRTASLRDAISQMEEFSYTVSHDLRAPLRSIKGYAEVLVNDYAGKLKGEAANYLERIIENGNRMERLVNDVLTMSRISSTKLRLERVELNPLLESIIREYPNFHPSDAQITVEPLPAVIGHESLCTQVFANLLGNAAKFVPEGTMPRIRVWAEDRGAFTRVNVRDNGIGIAPEFHQKIFGMFERLDPENHFGGTGIGLAIVRRAAEKMNGRVGVESAEGAGSLFWVDLPKATA